jgi:hypothetical protein
MSRTTYSPTRVGRLPRGVVVGLLLSTQFIAAIGFPIPAAEPGAVKDLSKPFPCQSRACGCHNAEQCWRGCCCFSRDEKLAWADAHGVEPPAYVRGESHEESGWNTLRVRDQESHRAEKPKACCSTEKANPSSCSRPASQEDRELPVRSGTSGAQRVSIRWVVGAMALKCQGQGPWALFSSIPTLPATPLIRWSPEQLCCGSVPVFGCTPPKRSNSPVVPPPRHV